MKKYIVEESELQCSAGSLKSKIAVTSQETSTIEDKKVATQKDFVGQTNIKPFGFCSILRGSCTPKTSKWNAFDEDYLIDETPTLLETSKCMCAIGGEILPVTTGKNDFVSKDEGKSEKEEPKQKETTILNSSDDNAKNISEEQNTSTAKELGIPYKYGSAAPQNIYQVYNDRAYTKSEWEEFYKSLSWMDRLFMGKR